MDNQPLNSNVTSVYGYVPSLTRKQRLMSARTSLERLEEKARQGIKVYGKLMEAHAEGYGKLTAIVTGINHCPECEENGMLAYQLSNLISSINRKINWIHEQIDLESGIVGWEYGIPWRK